jgi:hypothetical protein
MERGSGLQRPHLAVAYIQQPALSEALPHAGDGGKIQRIIGPLARHDIRRHGQPQGIQDREHHLDLRQIRAMVLAVAKLEQPILRDGPIAARRGTIEAHPLGLQVVHAQQVLGQGAFKSLPAGIIAQRLQHGRQAVVTDIERVDPLPASATQGLEPLLGPGFDVVEPMVRFR